MLILALESSAKAASVALCRDGVLIAQSQQCSGLTHSCTLLPMAEQMLKNTDTKLADVTPSPSRAGRARSPACASACPRQGGSPGARRNLPSACPRSRLWRITASRRGEGALVCAAMDARRSQIYNALFEIRGGKPVRLCEDRAISLCGAGRRTGKNAEIRFSGWRRRAVVL